MEQTRPRLLIKAQDPSIRESLIRKVHSLNYEAVSALALSPTDPRPADSERPEIVLLALEPGQEIEKTINETKDEYGLVPVVVWLPPGWDDSPAAIGQAGPPFYCLAPDFTDRELARVIGAVLHAFLLEKELAKAEEAFLECRRQLFQAQKMEALGTLVAGVAHEINNPINLINLDIGLIKKVWRDLKPVIELYSRRFPEEKFGGLTYEFLRDNLDQLLSDVEIAASRVATIGNDLKKFARKTDAAEKEPISINQAVKNALRLGQTTIRKSGVALKVKLAEGLPPISGSINAVEQIVLNLVINAVQATNHRGGEVEVSTRTDERESMACLLIKDNGRGIDPSIADHIFDPFFTTRQAEGGTGLGLSVTNNLVQLHGGRIGFKSEPATGTVFEVGFPVLSPAAPDSPHSHDRFSDSDC
ncbi:MAG: ATP-binding protein [Thermodesulfobacteriota bacterium]